MVSRPSTAAYDHLGAEPGRLRLPRGRRGARRGRGRWRRFTALEADVVEKTPVRPRTLRAVPESFRTGLDAVLDGVDGNTYLFKGRSCYDVRLGREFPTARGLGPPAQHRRRRQAASTPHSSGRDGKTYVFSGDQFVVLRRGPPTPAPTIEGHPRPISEHWGGPDRRDASPTSRAATPTSSSRRTPTADRRYVVYSGPDYAQPDPGYPAAGRPRLLGHPRNGRDELRPSRRAVRPGQRLLLSGSQYLQRAPSGAWSYPRPLTRLWPGLPLGTTSLPLRTAFTGADGATYFFSRDEFACYADGRFCRADTDRPALGTVRNNVTSAPADTAVDAAFVWRGTTLSVLRRPVRPLLGAGLSAMSTPATRKPVVDLRQEPASRTCPWRSSRCSPTASPLAARP